MNLLPIRLLVIAGFVMCEICEIHAQKSIEVFQLPSAPAIDGIHEEKLWQNAQKASLLH